MVRARRHEVTERADAPGMSVEAGGMERDREAGLAQRFPDRRVHRMVEVAVVVRVRSREAGLQTERRDATRFVGRALRVLHRERADTDEPVGLLRAPVGEPVVVDRAARDREVGVLDRAELQAEPGIHHRDVDALGVEHLHPLVRIEAGGVEVLVVAAPTEVGERLARVAQADEPAIGRHAVLDEALVVAGRFVPPQADAAVAHRGGEVVLPQPRRFAQMAVGVDHRHRTPARVTDWASLASPMCAASVQAARRSRT